MVQKFQDSVHKETYKQLKKRLIETSLIGVISLPAGEVRVAFGAEYYEESFSRSQGTVALTEVGSLNVQN